MATINGFTKEHQEAIMNATVVSGSIVGDDLILTHFDASTTNAGDVRGPTGSPGITQAEMDELVPIGSIKDYCNTTPPNAKWSVMTGNTLVNAQTLNTILWGRVPASWKSGSDIIFPDTRGRSSIGHNASDVDFDTIGEIGGAKTVTLSGSEIPGHVHAQTVHAHTIDPPNTAVSVFDPSHNHSQNAHNHTQNSHTHIQFAHDHTTSLGGGYKFIMQGGSGGSGVASTPGPYILTDSNLTNQVTPGIQPETATNQAATASNNASYTGISATVDIAPFSSANSAAVNTGSTGGNGAHNNMPPYVVFLKMIRII